MKHLTIWASKHILLFRIIIPIGFLVLFILNYFLGLLLQNEGQLVSQPLIFLIVFGVLLLGFSIYPSRKRIKAQFNISRGFYYRWKLLDLILILAFCGISFYCGTHSGKVFEISGTAEKTMINESEISSVIPFNSIDQFEKKKTRNLKERISSFFNRIGTKMVNFYHKLNNGNKALFVGLIVLFALLYIGLVYLLAIGACAIACSGYGVLALIVYLLGEALLFLGLFYSISGLKNSLDRKEGAEPDRKKNRKIGWIVSLSLVAGKYLALLFTN